MNTTPAMPEFIRVLVKVQGGDMHSTEAQFMNDDIGYLVGVPREWQLASLQAQPAEVSDAEIDAVTLEQWGPDAIRAAHRQYARAILALRQQSEPAQPRTFDDRNAKFREENWQIRFDAAVEARRAAQEQLYTERERHTAEVKRLQAEIGRLKSERPQAAPVGFDVEAMIRSVLPGGNYCDPQAVADAIRDYVAASPQAVPMTDERAVLEDEEFSLLSQTQVAALLWVLWCHQGASSPVGQPIRFALGMDKRQAMSDEQVSAAQRFRIDWHQWSGITAPAGGEV